MSQRIRFIPLLPWLGSALRLLAVLALALSAIPLTPTVPAAAAGTWYVAPTGNDSAACTTGAAPCSTISGAIKKAAAGDTINIAAGTYAERIILSKNLTLSGAGAERTFLDDGDSTSGTLVTIDGGVTVTISGLTIQNGNGEGGGINNKGTLTVSNSAISENYSRYRGGGIYNSGTLTLNRSMVSENWAGYWERYGTVIGAYGGEGVGIYNAVGGKVIINDSTISKNQRNFICDDCEYVFLSVRRASYGAGIYNASGGRIEITNSTLSFNTFETNIRLIGGDAIGGMGEGGGIYNAAGGSITISSNTNILRNHARVGGGIQSAGVATINNAAMAYNIPDSVSNTGRLTVASSTLNLPGDRNRDYNVSVHGLGWIEYSSARWAGAGFRPALAQGDDLGVGQREQRHVMGR